MADLITSNAVDAFMQAADAAMARTAIGAAPVASPTFTGTPAAPTATPGTNTTQVATTAFVTAAVAAGHGGGGNGGDLGFAFDGAGSTLTAGLAGDRQINATRTITGWSLLGNASGSLSVLIRKATISGGTVGSFSTIYTAALSSAQFASGDGTGFTSTALTATDVLRAEVASASGISKATLIIKA